MGDLKRVGDCLSSKYFNPKSYEARKKYWLSTVDPQTEYAVYGRIYCKHCRGEKSVDMPERFFYTKCSCPCQEQARKREQERRNRIERVKRNRELNARLIPTETVGASFYRIFDEKSSEGYINTCLRCSSFCKKFGIVQTSGRGVWLYGGFDTGKTYLAVAILNELQNDGVLCCFTTMERILEELKATYGNASVTTEQAVISSYVDAECLILDDFSGIKASSKRSSDGWASDKFCEIIKRRCDKHRPTIVTSRFSIRELTTEGLLPRGIVDKLVNKMVELKLVDKQRRAKQQEIEF